ncbi:four helix bundle protein [Sphingobacterium bovistauri]|uniref:Four helix bundle protein n=1 Tax=Sphingobacterium bovistauri TaxID=2781959 RepID=A0ABS7Z4D9_9SPHI|nr:four helix bundle protein [Sphingobacterium bovistauri]MCA5005056.1 four helix bundle protein [Sphingobacterium bovistauri]
MHKFRDLVVWQKAMDLANSVYMSTENLPVAEKFGLLSQIRRSAVSICSNIAEGAGRNTKGEFIQFLGIANGSAYELETQL